ncbi:universal stress protein [Nocardioides pyridinolyticus]
MLLDWPPLVVALPDRDDEALLRFAAREALVHGCAVRLVRVRRDDGPREERLLAAAIARTEVLAGPGVVVTGTIITGQAVASVLQACGDDDTRVVVVRRRDVLHLTRAIVEGGRAGGDPPIACVPTSWSPIPDDPRPVVVGVDDPASSSDLLGAALEIAQVHNAPLRIVHAWRLPDKYQRMVGDRIVGQWTEQLRASLDELVRRCGVAADSHVATCIVVVPGVAADVLAVEATRAQFLVIRRNHEAGGTEHVGRTTRYALHECPCPVILTPRTRTLDEDAGLPLRSGPGVTGPYGPVGSSPRGRVWP